MAFCLTLPLCLSAQNNFQLKEKKENFLNSDQEELTTKKKSSRFILDANIGMQDFEDLSLEARLRYQFSEKSQFTLGFQRAHEHINIYSLGFRHKILQSEKFELLSGFDLKYGDINFPDFYGNRNAFFGSIPIEMNYKINDRLKFYSSIEIPFTHINPKVGFQYQIPSIGRKKKKLLSKK